MSEYKQLWCLVTKSQVDAIDSGMLTDRDLDGALLAQVLATGASNKTLVFTSRAEAEACLNSHSCHKFYHVAVVAWKT